MLCKALIIALIAEHVMQPLQRSIVEEAFKEVLL